MKIELKFFASVREALGVNTEILELPGSVRTVGDLRAYLLGRGSSWAEVLAPHRALRMAVDQQMAGPDALLADGCEVAFFPPVTGG